MAPTNSYGQEMVSIYLIKIKITTKFFKFMGDSSLPVLPVTEIYWLQEITGYRDLVPDRVAQGQPFFQITITV